MKCNLKVSTNTIKMGAQVPQIFLFYQDLKNEVLLNGSNLMQTDKSESWLNG